MITPDLTSPVAVMLDDLSTEEFLQVVGQRVRQQRARKSMSRKRLAEVSTVSERYLAQLESGQGNMSIALLRKVTSAIGISMGALMSEEVTETCINRPDTVSQQDPAPVTAQGIQRARVAGAAQGDNENGLRPSVSHDSRPGVGSLIGSSSVKIAEV